jgi:L-fuconolactonase
MDIDSHHHFWRLERGDYAWITPEMTPLYRDYGPEDLQPLLARHGIQGTVLVQAAETVAETEYLLSIADQHDFVLGVVGWFDLADPQTARRHAALLDNPHLKGFRPIIQDRQAEWMLGRELRPAIDALCEQGLRFDALLKPPHLARFNEFLQLYPRLPIVIDHAAKPNIAGGQFDDWARDLRAVASDPRVFCKVSGLATEAASDWRAGDLTRYLDQILEAFTPARLMWGSDWPVVELAGGFTRWRDTAVGYLQRLSRDEQAQIFGKTAASFYGLAART